MSGDTITVRASDAVGEIREALRVTIEAERLLLARASGEAGVYLIGAAFEHAIGRMANNVAMRLLSREWGR